VVNSRATAGERPARHLTAEDLAGLRAALHEQLRFHRERSEGGGPGPASTAPSRMVLADVEAALRRMDDGRYGDCRQCGRPVDRDWLLVVPQARRCPPCRGLRATDRAAGR
jgi:hypothetical protein